MREREREKKKKKKSKRKSKNDRNRKRRERVSLTEAFSDRTIIYGATRKHLQYIEYVYIQ